MSDDLRKDRSESSEGRGNARRAWDRYVEAAGKVRPKWWEDAFKRLTGTVSADLIGFWMSWHLYGGFEGLETAGWHRATIYRKLKRFRSTFGKHPDDYEIVGVNLDRDAFWDHYLKSRRDSQK